MEPTTWYLIRHGETAWNRELRIQGATDVPLNDIGRAQAAALLHRLGSVAWDSVYASDLARAVETAQIATRRAESSIHRCPELRELSYGRWEGLTSAEAQALDPTDYQNRFDGRREDFAAPGGETSGQLLKRVRRFHDAARLRHTSGQHILVCGHGGSLRALLVCLLNLPATSLWSFDLSNASLSIVKAWPQAAVLECWNDISHLSELGSPR